MLALSRKPETFYPGLHMKETNGFQAVVGLDSLSFAAHSNPDIIISGGTAHNYL